MNKTKAPMQSLTQIENLVKKAKTYTIISAYVNIKRKKMLLLKGLSEPPYPVFQFEKEYKLGSFHSDCGLILL